jgi:hypothetical protein
MKHKIRKNLPEIIFVLLLLFVSTAQAQSQNGFAQEKKKIGMELFEGNWRQFVGGEIWECSHYRFQIKGDEDGIYLIAEIIAYPNNEH